jgi:hypothetical protein
MSSRFDAQSPMALEEQAHADARSHFAEYLKRFTTYRESVERLERNLSIMSLAANIAASSSTSKANILQTVDDTQWQQDVDLMENVHLCRRMLEGEAEFAAVEHFPANNTNEIWNRGFDAVDVVRAFAQEQRQALQVWTEDAAAGKSCGF